MSKHPITGKSVLGGFALAISELLGKSPELTDTLFNLTIQAAQFSREISAGKRKLDPKMDELLDLMEKPLAAVATKELDTGEQTNG